MFVLSMDLLFRDTVPRITHPLLDVRFRERTGGENALPPEVTEGIVEGRETFGCCRRHLDHFRQLLTAPVMELLHHLAFIVD